MLCPLVQRFVREMPCGKAQLPYSSPIGFQLVSKHVSGAQPRCVESRVSKCLAALVFRLV